MDPQVYDYNATIDLSLDKQNIVRQLSDMFYGYSLIYIRGICEACLWNVDLCIDKLIGEGNVDIINHEPPKQQPNTTTTLNYSQTVQKPSVSGAVPKTVSTVSSTKQSFQDLPSAYAHVYNDIAKGYKVLVLMRGPPGSGKSYLAKSIVKKMLPGKDWKDFVLGADDYFFDVRGRYRYNVDRLEDAHQYCQTRAREKMSLGYSPIFIDNTNHALWEMMSYVKVGVENGYIIEIVEPLTPWRNSAGKLAAKNIHNVPKQKIQRMLDRYEVGTTKDLLGLLKDTKYTVALPQLRTYPSPPDPEPVSAPVQNPVPEPQAQPPPPQHQPKTQTKVFETTTETVIPSENIVEPLPTTTTMEMERESNSSPIAFNDPANIWPSFEPLDDELLPAYKSPTKSKTTEQEEDPELKQEQEEMSTPIKKTSKPLNPEAASFWGVPFSTMDTNKEYGSDMNEMMFPAVPTVWQAYEQEATNFWGVPVTAASNATPEPVPMEEGSSTSSCGLLQLLKEGVKSINVPNKDKQSNEKESTRLDRHRIGCVNENESFIAFRQIYPNKPNAELWDLFVKCNGSIDWAVDILLKDEDSVTSRNSFQESVENCDNFDCFCDRPESCPPAAPSMSISMPEAVIVKPQRQKLARNRAAPSSAQLLEVKEAVEKSFVLGEEHYSSHVKKIRNKRNATEDSNNKKTLVEVQVQTDDLDENDNSEEGGEDSEVIEINLGVDLIGQLSEIFISETTPLEAPEKYKPNVFMPKALARELYVLWMESVYNQQEEQRQSLLKEDEEFARLLKNPKYQNLKQPPENIKELLDMEYAWMIYNKEQEQYNGLASKHPNDLASHLTRMKLCEIFPNIPRETLLDILAAHNNKFSDTVEVLKSSIQPATVDHQVSAEVLIEKARTENEMLKEEEDKQEQKILKNNNSNSFTKIHSNKQQESSNRQRSLSPEEAKRLALSEFEETRNYAAHHCQLRAECYQKAKEAIQRGNSGVAVYYSQIANLHKRKIDIYNHRAANCIMEVHDLTQNNPDFIDLHYLHVVEAVACLDIFVDRHIAKLRSIFRSFKYVFIITGRGLHSTGGVSMIKTRVKSRLKERNLKWSEVNPGLLKVKIFSASKYSKNL
ncbi:NEDD4-binding protein 2 [Episyrphus balteatus]|uniref:NEDD4-binding protein 2 n=1 Tax=Episyrphus balteatus TaxID=286459 RepID=UPI0024856031|nr:NEDD4-binding protein 2 [Episyrphus balteatus]